MLLPDYPAAFAGFRIRESEYLTVRSEVDLPRTWWERWFTRPWRPHVRRKTVTRQVPHPGAIQLGPGVLLMHPETLRRLRDTVRVPTGV